MSTEVDCTICKIRIARFECSAPDDQGFEFSCPLCLSKLRFLGWRIEEISD